MPSVPLTSADNQTKGKQLMLDLGDTEATLRDGDGCTLLTMPRSAVVTDIIVPGALMSGSNIIVNSGSAKYEFAYDKAVVAALQAYQKQTLASDGSAVAALKRSALWRVALGVVIGIVCWTFIVVLINMKKFPDELGPVFTFAWMPALASPFLVIGGILTYLRAGRHDTTGAGRGEVPPVG